MKIKVVKRYSNFDVNKLGWIYSIDIYVGKELIAEYDDGANCFEKLEGFIDALKYTHGNKLVVIEDDVSDYCVGR